MSDLFLYGIGGLLVFKFLTKRKIKTLEMAVYLGYLAFKFGVLR